MPPPGRAARILVVDADPILAGLLTEWLLEEGYAVVEEGPDLMLVDVPLPRERGADLLRQLATRYPGKPLVALSSNFFARIEANGAVARALGAHAVLPKPLSREALMGAIRGLLPRLG